VSLETYKALIAEHKPHYVVGFDEVGNGAIAGDLCVAGCALHVGFRGGLKDSKKYTEKAREKAYQQVLHASDARGVYMLSPERINSLGHKRALDLLFTNALNYMYGLFGDTAIYIVDGTATLPEVKFKHTALAKADSYVPAVSAASILAKCERDAKMRDAGYEEWNFAKHKGYPTKFHTDMLKNVGPIEGFHRMNVKTVQTALDAKGWYR
jgi:ribonuclease HII